MDTFSECAAISTCLQSGNEREARNRLIQLLDQLSPQDRKQYSPLVNRLAREVGLYPYIEPESSTWEDRFVFEAFKADVGESHEKVLHREQQRLLNALLLGESVAVSAPTSFGKSFVIDAFIAIRKPSTVLIIVPTIALADETRRRLHRKFGDQYKIITTAEDEVLDRNILILPQERALSYIGKLQSIDILIVDEFYKASKAFDKERAPSLIRAIVELSKVARQRYFLAPNISALNDGIITEGMRFVPLDFNTVFLERHDVYLDIAKKKVSKESAMLQILAQFDGKTLIYAGSHSEVSWAANALNDAISDRNDHLLNSFGDWLADNYGSDWLLTNLVRKGIGIHNGQLHRAVSQIQIKLFEEPHGLSQLISTSSIIEGVNTSAKNVIVSSKKKGTSRLDSFSYKNIIGRAGRMFQHFVGRIFLLEPPPKDEDSQLDLGFPDEVLGIFDDDPEDLEYTPEQIEKRDAYHDELRSLVGPSHPEDLAPSDLNSSNTEVILRIARDIRNNPESWNGLGYLNSDDPRTWSRLLMRVVRLHPGAWGTTYTRYIRFVQHLSNNWTRSIPQLLDDMSDIDVTLDEFFELERNTTYKLAGLLADISTIYNRIYKHRQVELSPAIAKFSSGFLPKSVFHLEEYGLPRMISRKLCNAGLVDLEAIQEVHIATNVLLDIGISGIDAEGVHLQPFERYLLRNFFDGIARPLPA